MVQMKRTVDGEEVPSLTPMQLERLVVVSVPSGPPKKRGEAHGAQLAKEIRALYDSWMKESAKEGKVPVETAKTQALEYAREAWKTIERETPDVAAEIDGIAHASGMSRLEITALNCNDEIGLVGPLVDEASPNGKTPAAHCSGCAFHGEKALLCQNWDCPLYYRPVVLLRVIDDDNKTSELHLTFAGIVGGPFLASSGLAAGWFTVIPTTPRKAGLPNAILLRHVASTCSSVAAALEFWTTASRSFGTCFFAADAEGNTAQFEADATRTAIRRNETVVHANHYMDSKLAGKDNDRLAEDPWTTSRSKRWAELLKVMEPGASVEDWMKKGLADQENMQEGRSICENVKFTGGMWESLSGVIMDPKAGLMMFTRGRPDDAKWEEIRMR